MAENRADQEAEKYLKSGEVALTRTEQFLENNQKKKDQPILNFFITFFI